MRWCCEGDDRQNRVARTSRSDNDVRNDSAGDLRISRCACAGGVSNRHTGWSDVARTAIIKDDIDQKAKCDGATGGRPHGSVGAGADQREFELPGAGEVGAVDGDAALIVEQLWHLGLG